MYTIKSDC